MSVPAPDVDVTSRLDPALHHLASARTDLSPSVLEAVRESLDVRRREEVAQVDTAGVDVYDDSVSAAGRSVPIRVYRGGGPAPAPAVVFCHSGAFVLGNLDTDHRQCVEFARRAGCTVISVDYRLAPEHPYPAALDDAATVLNWAADNATNQRIDLGRLAVAGSSAGAALVAGLAQRSAEGSAPPVLLQMLHQPVLDDRPTQSKAEFVAAPGFDGPAAEWMWRHYLGATPASADAVPGRQDRLTGLAPTFISCSELDPLRDEALGYAQRLLEAGVHTELHVFPGTCHGFDSLAPQWEVSRQLFELQGLALWRAFDRG